jgi:hypothetical protein
MNLVWKKYQTLTNVAEKFLVKLRGMMFDLPNPPTGLPIQ